MNNVEYLELDELFVSSGVNAKPPSLCGLVVCGG